jgi:hypothetical protein
MPQAWVLWHMYGDGSGAHVERVYLDEARAEEDFKLTQAASLGTSEWKLDVVPIVGPQ